MDEKSSELPEVKEMKKETEKTAWYTPIIEIFKKLLEWNYNSYGTKKEF